MPVLRFPPEMLLEATGARSLDRLRDALFRLKCETDILEDGSIEVEVNPDRPDMYSVEGIARAVRGILGLEKGWRPPARRSSGLTLEAGSVPTRPYIAAAVLWGVNIRGEDDLRQLIQFQEKLHDTIGRRRRKVAIGFHDLSKMPGTRVRYVALPIDEARFTPLGSREEITGREVLERTEQGRIYGRISLAGDGTHPFLLAGDTIIAMPPVINSEITRVEDGTRDLFVDVTGTDLGTVLKVLDIIVSNLAERGATVGTVAVSAPYPVRETPQLSEQVLTLSVEQASQVLGYSLTPGDAARLLEAMRHNIDSITGGAVRVRVPPFRADIIGPIDLVEDIAIAVGYESLYPVYQRPATRGSLSRATRLARTVRTILLGLGFQEIMQLTLTSPSLLEALGLSGVPVENPVQQEYSVLRPSLAPGLLASARENQHAEKPVRLFEVGRVVLGDGGVIREEDRIGLMIMDAEVSVEMIQSPLYAMLRALGVPFTVEPSCGEPFLLDGRCASLLLEGERLGYFGEVSPGALERLGIEYPVALAEVRPEVILEWRSRTSGQA